MTAPGHGTELSSVISPSTKGVTLIAPGVAHCRDEGGILAGWQGLRHWRSA